MAPSVVPCPSTWDGISFSSDIVILIQALFLIKLAAIGKAVRARKKTCCSIS